MENSNGKHKWRSVDFFNKTLKKLTFFSGATQMENSNEKLKWKTQMENSNGKHKWRVSTFSTKHLKS
jgi:hypothetical protein